MFNFSLTKHERSIAKKMHSKGYRWILVPWSVSFEPLYTKSIKQAKNLMLDYPETKFCLGSILPLLNSKPGSMIAWNIFDVTLSGMRLLDTVFYADTMEAAEVLQEEQDNYTFFGKPVIERG